MIKGDDEVPSKVSIIIPAYNEQENLEKVVKKTLDTLMGAPFVTEVLIAEDGSKDESYEIACRLAETNDAVRVLHFKERLGRGRALDRAFREASGEVVCYIDADMATDMRHLPELIDTILIENYEFATGSRLLPLSSAKRSQRRLIASKIFNLIVRAVLGSKIHDHQCGFKAFRKSALLPLLDEVDDPHWFWDTEVLVRGQCQGYKIKEIPVQWKEANSTKVDLFGDASNMGRKILRLRLKLAHERKKIA